MNPQIAQMIAAYASALESIKARTGDSPELEEFSALILELNRAAAQSRDVEEFTEHTAESGIFTRLDSVMRRLGRSAAETGAGSPAHKIPTVEEFIAPHRAAYEMIKNEACMKRTREAYEKYFALAEEAQSLPELKRLAEKGNLPLALNSSPVYDSYSLLYETHDPNLEPLRAREESLMSAAEEARSTDELRYLVEMAVRRAKRELAVEEFHAFLTVMLAGKILSYDIGKANARLSPEQFLAGFIMMREEIITTYTIMAELFGLDWETIIDTPSRTRELLLFENLSSQTSRIARCLDPQNIEWMREMLFEEILTEKSAAELLLRRSRLVFHPSAPVESSDEALRKISRAGWEAISRFEWADESKMLY